MRKNVSACCFCKNAEINNNLNWTNDFSAYVLTVSDGYRILLESGDAQPTVIKVEKWYDEHKQWGGILDYKMKYCPECGRRLTENDKFLEIR